MPQINVYDHKFMMKMNEVKKDKAIRIILNRRWSDKKSDNNNVALEVE